MFWDETVGNEAFFHWTGRCPMGSLVVRQVRITQTSVDFGEWKSYDLSFNGT